ncbi:hypothetical protein [Stenotrophomonas oahuensis]|uniref:HTH marR-type domain-containing protein n=1 Tax=Stenotrophomonas oahuensis TaxID=3003271 RepID=A0ABY9YNC9_9GAMM|nr:hypothetical protein [Stenotrophomonas sp. A5586]WNH52408.1 hypothetical protein PDM29_19125 [Stenotrophomonas sp. A5586]
MSVQQSALLVRALIDLLGPDATLRQALALLVIAQSGEAGTDQTALATKTDGSPAAISRYLKWLGPIGLGLIETFLDPADGRLRLSRLTKAGRAAIAKLTGV